MFEKKYYITKLLFKRAKLPNYEKEAIKLNYVNLIEVEVIKILLKYKKKLEILKSSINLIDSIENNAYFIEITIQTPNSLKLIDLNEFRSKIKNFMVLENHIQYISISDTSDLDKFVYHNLKPQDKTFN